MAFDLSCIYINNMLYLYKLVDGINYYINTIASNTTILNLQVSSCGTIFSYIEAETEKQKLYVYRINMDEREVQLLFYYELDMEPDYDYSIIYNNSTTAVAFHAAWNRVVVYNIDTLLHDEYYLPGQQHTKYVQYIMPTAEHNFLWSGYDNTVRIINNKTKKITTVEAS
jgi:hypothetical protein